MNPLRKFSRHRRGGFTLVEVTLAMGIASMALVTMVGTVAVGLNTVKDASDDSMHSQILSHIASAISQTPYDQIEDVANGPVLYYDQIGRQLPNETKAIYRVDLTLSTGGVDTFPGAPADLDPSLRGVRVQILTQPQGAAKPVASSYASIMVPHS